MRNIGFLPDDLAMKLNQLVMWSGVCGNWPLLFSSVCFERMTVFVMFPIVKVKLLTSTSAFANRRAFRTARYLVCPMFDR